MNFLLIFTIFLFVANAAPAATRFDPAGLVRIYEDHGSGRRLLLYDSGQKNLDSRLLKADSGSTLVVDLSKAFDEGADAGLNHVFVKASLRKGTASTPVEVTGYTTIGESAKDATAQNAFAFQTFDNIAGKLQNLYFVAKDALNAAFPGCDVTQQTCELPADPALRKERLDAFAGRMELFAPERNELSDFFSQPRNRPVTAQLANQIFQIDVESLQAVAQQMRTDAPGPMLERVKLTMQHLSGLARATKQIADAYTSGINSLDAPNGCPATVRDFGKGIARVSQAEFARRCYAEFVRPRYVEALKQFLAEGTISLASNRASDGDVLVIEAETRGINDAPGMKAEWQIRIQDFGWRAGVRDTLLFVKRKGGAPVAPLPGFTLGANYLGRRGSSLSRILSPGVGLNVTLMTSGASTVELGSGPVVSLFNNRLTVTYGLNLMQQARSTYWGIGFGFIQLGSDIAGAFKPSRDR